MCSQNKIIRAISLARRFRAMKAQALLISTLAPFGIVPAFGQTPTPTPANVPPDATEIYARAHDGVTCLQWNVYLPDAVVFQFPRPAVLVAHTGGWRCGSRNDDGAQKVATSLRNAGFIACSIDYRLDQEQNFLGVPREQICNSGCERQAKAAYAHGLRPPADEIQINDVQKAIIAARNPTCGMLVGKVNHLVGLLGGSAGGTHALTAAACWTTVNNRPDAVVCLSGVYQFNDPEFLAGQPQNRTNAYIYCQADSDTHPNLANGSNLELVVGDCAPVYAFGSEFDSITPHQLELLQEKFTGLDPLDHLTQRIDGSSKHAFAYWYDPISVGSSSYVYNLVQNWLADRLIPMP